MQICMDLKNENELKISFVYSLGIIRINSKEHYHDNVIKIDEIKNLFLNDEGVNIVTEMTNFQYKFSKEITRKIYNKIANNYINYYSVQIDNKNLLLEDLNEQEK